MRVIAVPTDESHSRIRHQPHTQPAERTRDCGPVPPNGPAHVEPPCEFRRVRGGSWDDSPPELRSARRSRVKPEVPRNDGGFRLARDLTADEIARLKPNQSE